MQASCRLILGGGGHGLRHKLLGSKKIKIKGKEHIGLVIDTLTVRKIEYLNTVVIASLLSASFFFPSPGCILSTGIIFFCSATEHPHSSASNTPSELAYRSVPTPFVHRILSAIVSALKWHGHSGL